MALLDLSNNKFSGVNPSSVSQWRNLSIFRASNNNLCGNIPVELTALSYLNTLALDGNQLSGKQQYVTQIYYPDFTYRATIFMMFLYFTFFKDPIGKKERNSSEQQEWKLKPFHRVETGGSEKVYSVIMNDAGGIVAVKRIWNGRKLEGALEKQFSTEVEILGTIRHANIVKLLCYVSSAQDKLLVYEYVENQSLDKWLNRKMEGNESSTIYSETSMNSHAPGILDWVTRLKIAIGAAKGLCYLHYDCSPSIVHRDVKSSNILLDSEFNAKIADFGLAMVAVKNGEPQTASGVKGSFGYIAPEYWRTKKLNVKIDVYSFRVVHLCFYKWLQEKNLAREMII
ncbi:leucine-rich repeat receptor-like serine/threonine-protein kinase BAM2 [Amaranthus tricolor]|uniref:leucine-rich repeat receptor-like serine/threonine-protein kinase BAM2 n=1 Tax=Amaranthus tricolor TaxID=29722 RepID=UPI00258517E0|nr:leucine-rich repeat receptor-like serine/threonine-protein kinase BAM2 [Amaranthus tricolor]